MFGLLKKKEKQQGPDLERVIFDIAEHQRESDFETLYSLLKEREVYLPADSASVPKDLVPGSRYITGDADKIKIRTVNGPNNLPMVFAATEPTFPALKDGYIGMRWIDVLVTFGKLENIKGVILQGKTSWIGFDESRIQTMLNGMPNSMPDASSSNPGQGQADTVVVPVDHKVNVFSPTPIAHVSVAPSSFVIIDYGRSGKWRATNVQLEAVLAKQNAPAVVILQNEMIQNLEQSKEFNDFITSWTVYKENGVQAVWVLPLEASKHASVVNAIRSIGFGVHGSAQDGACFVEVHKTDENITIGMPGPTL